MKRKGSRNVTVDGKDWNYLVGKKFIDIRGPNKQKFLLPKEYLGEMIRIYQCEWGCGEDECRDNQREDLAVFPKAVKNYIQHHQK